MAEILEAVVGEVGCAELRTSHLGERFENFRLYRKSLLIGSDVRHNFLLEEGAAELKKLTGGDLISAEKKGSNESFHFRGDLNVLITTNSRLILRLFSDAGAWRRRLIIIKFPPSGRTIEQNKPEYPKTLLKTEAPGVLNWALEGAEKLLNDLATGDGFVLSDEQKSRVYDRINESDSLTIFLKECLQASERGEMTTKTILDDYSNYCRAHGWGFPGEQTVFRRLNDLLSALFGAHQTKSVKNHRGEHERGYQGVCRRSASIAGTIASDEDDVIAKQPTTFSRIGKI